MNIYESVKEQTVFKYKFLHLKMLFYFPKHSMY